jgi:hypothetical protein
MAAVATSTYVSFSGRCRDVKNSWGGGSRCCSGRDGGNNGYVNVWRLVATAPVANMNPAVAVTMARTTVKMAVMGRGP